MAHGMLIQAQQHVFRYQSFHINKSQPLGHGSYGAVYKAKCDELPCAAKILHPTILDPKDPGADKIMERFQQECAFLESIRHPNIVQYLGMTRDPESRHPESRLPVLLMELLDENLTVMLERSQRSLAYYTQVDICHDIALAVAYLHSNDIIHRDLSSNNVLMIAGRRAKVTDFGMSKLSSIASSATPLTTCPGTVAYMPPEALREPLRYTKKLDCFSEGVIMIQVCTRLWPEPGPRTQIIQDSRSLTGIMEMPVPETHRRKNHIDLIDPNHTLLPIINDCLQFKDKDRPSSEELCQRLADLKEFNEYRDNIRIHHDEIQAKDDQISVQARQLQRKDRLLQQRADELQVKDKRISQLQQRHQEEIASRNKQVQQLNQELEKKEQIIAKVQKANKSLQRQVEQLQQQLRQQNPKPPQPPPPSQAQVRKRHMPQDTSPQVDSKSHLSTANGNIALNWRGRGKVLPLQMSRGAAVVDENVAYFMNWSGSICSYNSSSKKWQELADCPYQYGSLVVIQGQLTTVGGMDRHQRGLCTNQLLSLQIGQKEFHKVFPSMPTKRCNTTTVTTNKHLVVAGGTTELGALFAHAMTITKVEVMGMKSLAWATVASLPYPYTRASGTICGEQLYMLGGSNDKDKTKSVLTCSLANLLRSLPSATASIWHSVADVPVFNSTCAAVNGELLAIGGLVDNGKRTAAVHKYNPMANSWELISNMPNAKYHSLVAVLPTNEMIVGGGKGELQLDLSEVEIAIF